METYKIIRSIVDHNEISGKRRIKEKFTGSKEYIAGVMCSAINVDQNLLNEVPPIIHEYTIGQCRFDAGPGLTLSNIKSKKQLLEYIANLNETEPEEEINTVTKRYLHVVLYGLKEVGGFERDVSYYMMFQFEHIDFIKGLKDAETRLGLCLNHDVILDILDYSCKNIS